MFRTGVSAVARRRASTWSARPTTWTRPSLRPRARSPPVVLLDVHLPGGTVAAALRSCAGARDLPAGARFLALSVSDAAEDVVAVIRAGARGYVTKAISGADLVRRGAPGRGRGRRVLPAPGRLRAGRLRRRGGRRRHAATTSWTGSPHASGRSCA